MVISDSIGQSLGDRPLSIDTDYLTWSASQVLDTKTGLKKISSDYFKTSPEDLEWTTDDGKTVYRLPIISKHQTWPDITTDGTTTFDVTWKGINGTIMFQRSNGDTRIVTTFTKDGVNTAPYEFQISDVTKN